MERLEVSLPHQCGEWSIGDIDHVRVMIADLTALLSEFEHPEKYRHPHICIACKEAFLEAGGTCSLSCSARQRQDLCETCSAAYWTKKAAIRHAAELEKLRSFPDVEEKAT